MFTKVDKAWVAALVSFLSMTAAQFMGFEIPVTVQTAVISVITGAFAWAVPNKA